MGLLTFAAVAAGGVVEAAGTEAGRGGSPSELSATMTVMPNKAGTTRDPQGVTLDATSEIATEPGFDLPVVTGFDLLIGRGLHWNGGRYPTCSKQVLDRGGPEACPRKSLAGTGVASVRAGDVDTDMAIAFVNGGARRLLASIRFDYPARVRETIAIKATETSGPWPYRYSLRVPQSLQLVAGVTIRTTGMRFTLGGKPYAKKLIASTFCPRSEWRYRITALYRYDSTGLTTRDTIAGSVPCTS